MRHILAVALFLGAAFAQQPGLLNSRETVEVCSRALDLMESTSASVPGLVQAGAPVRDNARKALASLRAVSVQNAPLTLAFLTHVRAYLALFDAVPKPDGFPEEAGRQVQELRERVNRLDAHFRALLEVKEAALRNPDRDNLRRYAQANETLGPPQAARPRVVFLGDSITDGWRLNEYFPDRDFVNRGISGQITGEMLGRMRADVIELKPAAVLILAGTNDIARGVPLPAIENNLVMIADLADHYQIKPLFASLLPVSDYHKDKNPGFEQTRRRPPETIRRLNNWIQAFCQQRNYVYVEYFPAVADNAGLFKAELADDGLHPNSTGYRVMAPVALAAIDQALAPPARKKGRR